MSVGPLANIGSFAAAPAVQRTVSTDQASTQSNRDVGEAANDQAAELAAGIGQTDGEQHETHERDGDGRLPWQFGKAPATSTDEEIDPSTQLPLIKSHDTSGERGSALDLEG